MRACVRLHGTDGACSAAPPPAAAHRRPRSRDPTCGTFCRRLLSIDAFVVMHTHQTTPLFTAPLPRFDPEIRA
eukprot:gene11467-biopygen18398